MSQPTNSKEPADEAAFGEAAPGDERTADEQKTEEKTYPAKVVEVHRIPYSDPVARRFSRYPF